MSIETYLKDTRYAIEQLLSNLRFYRDLYSELLEALHEHKDFVFSDEYNSDPENPDYDKELARYEHESTETQARCKAALSKLPGAGVSRNAIAGAIVQIAFMGIKMHSKRTDIPEGWEAFGVSSKGSRNNLRLFGGGRLVWGQVPVGLVIYAARNQYNHYDEAPKNALVQEVFRRIRSYGRENLAFEDVPSFDTNAEGVADHLLSLLGWNSYEQVAADLRAVL